MHQQKARKVEGHEELPKAKQQHKPKAVEVPSDHKEEKDATIAHSSDDEGDYHDADEEDDKEELQSDKKEGQDFSSSCSSSSSSCSMCFDFFS